MPQAIGVKTKIVSMVPTIDTAIYASGDQLGSLVELTNVVDDSGGTGVITSVVVIDQAKQSSAMSLLLFKDKPTVASADNAALNISDAEMVAKCLGHVAVASGDYAGLSASSVGTVKNVQLVVTPLKSGDNRNGTSLWGILMSGGTPTYASTTDLKLLIGVKQG